MNIVVIHAGMSEHASTVQLGTLIADELVTIASEVSATPLSIEWIAMRPLAHQITDHILTGFPPADLAVAQESVAKADAIVALSPTYQASYSGLFKSFFDVLPENSLENKPVLIGATGGTPRHAQVTESALRPLFSYLHADTVPTAIYAATEDWGAHATDSAGDGGEALIRRVRRAARQLLMRANSHLLSNQGNILGVTSGFSAPLSATLDSGAESVSETWPGFTDFETLMGGSQ
ncbi:CE1759 family FMN reductase [Schaalia suimastitidis]|uniref:CE1759 family FMN reductase n=1 Tax=Schaalia suimastitidis TaxID=121163 RepID=UPI0004016D7D|nr:CE1759 family FMN reductase [Schaalia suimastitidis]